MPHPEISIEFEVRCASCLRGLCGHTHVLKGKKRGIYAIFVPFCGECYRSIKAGKELTEIYRHHPRQMSAIEDGDFEGMAWWDESTER